MIASTPAISGHNMWENGFQKKSISITIVDGAGHVNWENASFGQLHGAQPSEKRISVKKVFGQEFHSMIFT